MKIEYAPAAVRDRREAYIYYRDVAGARIAAAFDERLRQTIERLRLRPEAAPVVLGRPDVRVLLLRRFPYKVFYRIDGDAIRILHIRHTARRAPDSLPG